MLNLLRKLGILRYGVKTGKFTSGKDMPTEFLMNDVANAEKELVHKEDVEKVRETLKTSKGKTVLKWIVIGIIGFLGLCFVLGLLFGTDEPVVHKGKVTEAKGEPAKAPSSFALSEPGPVATRPVTVEDEIHAVFDRIGEANRTENIDAFMQYYAASFPDRAVKQQKTLETWQQYDFLSLDFFVFGLDVQGNRANASVGWEIALMEKGAKQPRLLETTNEVVLEKGGAGWQIVSLK